jgi:hypothetical protein
MISLVLHHAISSGLHLAMLYKKVGLGQSASQILGISAENAGLCYFNAWSLVRISIESYINSWIFHGYFFNVRVNPFDAAIL